MEKQSKYQGKREATDKETEILVDLTKKAASDALNQIKQTHLILPLVLDGQSLPESLFTCSVACDIIRACFNAEEDDDIIQSMHVLLAQTLRSVIIKDKMLERILAGRQQEGS